MMKHQNYYLTLIRFLLVSIKLILLRIIDRRSIMIQNKNKRGKFMKKKQLRFNNTYDSGRLTFLMFRDIKKNRFIAICLEFDLETEGPTEAETQEKILELANLWLENVKENNLSEQLLNKNAPEKYWNLYNKLEQQIESSKKTINYYLDSIKVIPVFSQLRPYSSSLSQNN